MLTLRMSHPQDLDWLGVSIVMDAMETQINKTGMYGIVDLMCCNSSHCYGNNNNNNETSKHY